jgi:uncharacterized repeat protein (TIGR03803 family)
MKIFRISAVLCTAWGCVAGLAHAQATAESRAPATIYSFCAGGCVDGAFVYPVGGATLVQTADGVLYGTTWGGGAYGHGTVFGLTTDGKLTMQYSFCAVSGCPDGSSPWFGLALDTNGALYGVTTTGGVYGYGTVFEITQGGTLITLHSFCASNGCADGSNPYAGLTLTANGDLYGTTANGGAFGGGTIFKITPRGALTTLYSFSGGQDGNGPQAPLVQATDGYLYGTTYSGGSNGNGTIFKITPGGTLATVYSFNGSDGGASQAGLVQAGNGDLYGTSKFGGPSRSGTIFKLTPNGEFTTLYSFSGTDGSWPNSALIQVSNGDLYGTTEIGGASGAGTIFEITPAGQLKTLYEFSSAYGGGVNSVYAGLLQAADGALYGTTERGGTVSDGTVFRFTIP